MKILITGGAGYIGTELVYALEQRDDVDSIVVYDNLSRQNRNLFIGHSKLKNTKVTFVQGDLLDSRKLKVYVDEAEVVYHLAGKVTTPFADHNPHEFDQINNWGTSELTYLVEQSNVQKYIYLSSISVYGASESKVNIDSSLNPKTFYGISKMHGEQHVERLLQGSKDVFILRLGNVYGYSKAMRFDSVINKFIFESNFSRRIRIFGNGNQSRSFVHIDRLTNELVGLGLNPFKNGIYNVVENTFSIHDIVDELKNLYSDLEMIYVNQNMPMRSLHVTPDERMQFLKLGDKSVLKSDLEEFRKAFSF